MERKAGKTPVKKSNAEKKINTVVFNFNAIFDTSSKEDSNKETIYKKTVGDQTEWASQLARFGEANIEVIIISKNISYETIKASLNELLKCDKEITDKRIKIIMKNIIIISGKDLNNLTIKSQEQGKIVYVINEIDKEAFTLENNNNSVDIITTALKLYYPGEDYFCHLSKLFIEHKLSINNNDLLRIESASLSNLSRSRSSSDPTKPFIKPLSIFSSKKAVSAPEGNYTYNEDQEKPHEIIFNNIKDAEAFKDKINNKSDFNKPHDYKVEIATVSNAVSSSIQYSISLLDAPFRNMANSKGVKSHYSIYLPEAAQAELRNVALELEKQSKSNSIFNFGRKNN
jgi:hypothetical protein